jgi:hypothetical protein
MGRDRAQREEHSNRRERKRFWDPLEKASSIHYDLWLLSAHENSRKIHMHFYYLTSQIWTGYVKRLALKFSLKRLNKCPRSHKKTQSSPHTSIRLIRKKHTWFGRHIINLLPHKYL